VIGPAPLETDRLLLRPLAMEHAEGLWKIWRSPDFVRHLAEPVTSLRDMTENIAARLARELPAGMGTWVWIDRESGDIVGRGAVFPSPLPDQRVETGWFLSCDRWGTGLAAEAARVQIAYAFETLGLPVLWAFVHPDNKPSARLAARLGFGDRGRVPLFDREYLAFSLDPA
jgi:RimJ/RimL family protein N-acetyltransferase